VSNDGPQVQRENEFRSMTDTRVDANTTASLGFSGLRPGASLNYDKRESQTAPNGNVTEMRTSLTAVTAVGEPARINASVTSTTDISLGGGDKVRLGQGVGVGFRYGSSPEVVAAVRGDYIRQDGQGLSPYFVASAAGIPGREPSLRLEAGACIKPDLGPHITTPNLCGGVYTNSEGKQGVRASVGYSF
jgi:hypothetical protein